MMGHIYSSSVIHSAGMTLPTIDSLTWFGECNSCMSNHQHPLIIVYRQNVQRLCLCSTPHYFLTLSLSYSSSAKHCRSLILFLSFVLLNQSYVTKVWELLLARSIIFSSFLIPPSWLFPLPACWAPPFARLVCSAISSICREAVPLSTWFKDFT